MAKPGVRDITKLQDKFKADFLEDLADRAALLERLLAATGWSRETLTEVFRVVHSIKGSAATFGLQVLVALCHPFEDAIQEAEAEPARWPEFVNLARRYVDLIQLARGEIRAGNEAAEEAESQLAALRRAATRGQCSVALVVNSRLLRQMCSEVAAELGARVVCIDDGIVALQRILSDPFQAAIISSELGLLRGEALVAAIQLSPHRNHGVRTILVCSAAEKSAFIKRQTDPDHIVVRDETFLPHLSAVLRELVGQGGHGRP